MKTDLKSLLTKKTLREYAGGSSYSRGEAYYNEGVVSSLVERNGKITATVRGSENYAVKLWADGDGLDYSCSCPFAQDEGEFCKHCVAVGLAWLAGSTKDKGDKGKGADKGVTIQDVEEYLRQQSVAALVELLMEQVKENERLRERLLLKVARATATGIDLNAFRKAIKKAIRPRGYMEYGEMYGYAQGIEEVLESVRDLLAEGFAAEVIELCELALEEIETALGQVDDSDGELGSVHEDWQQLHHEACVEAKPDAVPLARRLYEWEMKGGWETFYGAVNSYADVLGEMGIAEYRRLAEAAWAKLPALKPGQNQSYDSSRFRLTSMMEALARQSGDPEALIEIKKKDLSAAWHYLQIAEIYQGARKYKEALDWAEQGKAAFPQNTDVRLLDFLADEYHRAKRPGEAMQIIWGQFAEKQGWHRYNLETYKKLYQHATRANCWPEWRERAWEALRDHLDEQKKVKPVGYWAQKVDHSTLVEIFLWEKNPEAAWAEAHAGGCNNQLWLKLAEWREKEHPADAIPIYQNQAEASINEKNNGGYEMGVKYIRKVRTLMQQLGKQDEFVTYVQAVRTTHKPKRNLMKLMDKL